MEVDVPEFNFAVERMSDLYSEGSVEIVCPSCETEFSGTAICTNLGCDISIDDPEAIQFTGDMPLYGQDPFDAYEPPSDPLALFEETINRTLQLAKIEFEAKNDPQFVKRIAFVNIITALEAYLADTLIQRVKSDAEALRRLARADSEWSREKVSIADLSKSENYLFEFMLAKLRETNFHNLNRVADLYKSALGVNLRYNKEHWLRLQQHIPLRHDCVHRNGYDFDGNRREDFTFEFIGTAASDCRDLVIAIEEMLFPSPF